MPINNGVGRIGIRSYVAVSQQITTSTLLNSLYSVWNADTLGTSLDTSIFGAWNGDGSNNLTVKNAWNANGNIVDSKSAANGTIATPSGTTFVTGTMSFGTGKLGSGAITFSGTNFVSLPNGTLTFTGDFSASFWIYVPTSFGTNYSRVLSAFDNSAGYTGYKGWDTTYSNGKMSLYIYPGLGTDYYSITVPMTLKDQWVHVAVTKVLGQQGNIYINGVAGVKTVDQRGSGSSTQAIAYNGTSNLAYMGASYFAFSLPYYTPTVAGGFKIDAIQTWDGVALDQTAVTELYNSGNGQEYPFTLSNALIGTPKDVVGTNHGTSPSGSAPTFTTGKIGKAFSFDGVNDYVALPNNSLNFTGDFSFSLWMNRKAAVNANILSNYYNGATPYGWWLSISNGTIAFRMGNGTSTYLCNITTTLLGANVWQLITITKNSSSVKMYVDGLLKTSATITGNVVYTTTHYPMIGAAKYDAGSPVGYLENGCLIDGVTTWQKELTSDEVTQLYNLSTGAQYPYSSQTLPSTNNQFGVDNVTFVNGCTFTDGKIGKAFLFDGVNDYITLPDDSLNFTSNFSYSFWIKTNNDANYGIIIGNLQNPRGSYGFAHGYCYWLEYGKIVTQYKNGNNITKSITSVTSVSNGQWNHVVITYNPGSGTNGNSTGNKIYINGFLDVSGQTLDAVGNTITYTSPMKPCIGARNFNGTPGTCIPFSNIDAISIWQKELTQAEVTELYNSGNGKQLTVATPIVTNGLVLNLDASRSSSYPNTGTTWFDISGNMNNGTLTNGPIFATANGGQITFDGINDYVVTSDTPFRFSNKFTISIWFYWDGLDKTNKTILGKRSGPGGNYAQYAMGINNGDVQYGGTGKVLFFYARVDGSVGGNDPLDVIMTYTLPSTSGIYNVSVTMDSNIQKLYINGVLVTSSAKNLVGKTYNISGREFLIGANRDDAGTGALAHFNGKIYSVYVYGRTLTDSETTQNFNATKSRFGL